MFTRIKRLFCAFWICLWCVLTVKEIRKATFENVRNTAVIAIIFAIGIYFRSYFKQSGFTLEFIILCGLSIFLLLCNISQFFSEILKPLKERFINQYCGHLNTSAQEHLEKCLIRPLSFALPSIFAVILFELSVVFPVIFQEQEATKKAETQNKLTSNQNPGTAQILTLVCDKYASPTKICESYAGHNEPTETLQFICSVGKSLNLVRWMNREYQNDIVVVFENNIFRLRKNAESKATYQTIEKSIVWQESASGWILQDRSLPSPIASACKLLAQGK